MIKQKNTLLGIALLLVLLTICFFLLILPNKPLDLGKMLFGSSVCKFENSQIVVGEKEECQSIREAIEAASGDMLYTITLKDGGHILSESLQVSNKKLLITGNPEDGSSSVWIEAKNNASITFEQSDVNFQWLTLKEVEIISENSRLGVSYTSVNNEGGTSFQVSEGGLKLENSEVRNSSIGVKSTNSASVLIEDVKFLANTVSLLAFESEIYIRSALFAGDKTSIELNQSAGSIENVTIVENEAGLLVSANSSIQISKTIIANNKKGIWVEEQAGTPLEASQSLIYGNETDFQGIDSFIGEKGNISLNPKLGDTHCLDATSPAIFGKIESAEFMGYLRYLKPICN